MQQWPMVDICKFSKIVLLFNSHKRPGTKKQDDILAEGLGGLQVYLIYYHSNCLSLK